MTRYIGPKSDGENVATQGDLPLGLLLNGTGAPSSGTGANGNFYIDTSTDELYGPKAGGTWGTPIQLGGSEQTRAFATFIS